MGFCKSCGKLINAYNGYCFDCKKAEKTDGNIPEQIIAGGFMRKMGIDGW